MTILELVRWPVTRYRLWRVQRWVLRWQDGPLHKDILPNNVIIDSEAAVDQWHDSAPRWVKREQNGWIVIIVGLFALFFVWEKRKRDRARAELAGRKAAAFFDAVEPLFSRRVVIEEFGDAREEIERWARAGELRRVRQRIATTVLRAP